VIGDPSLQMPARVVLVGFEDQDNLGLRYLSSRLKAAGHRTRIVAFGSGAAPVWEAVRALEPHIVGFSLIFQYMVPQFRDVLAELRNRGVTAHLTMGGHYASFEPAALLRDIPQLDSVVRFEGEDTLLELAQRVAAGQPWMDIPGLAYRAPSGAPSEVVLSAPRQGRGDLDELPWPDRDDIPYEQQKIPTASVLGSRGCPWVCSFCSIITFYQGNGTKGRRRRDPFKVVDELEYLHRQRGVRIVLWQDDDFLAGGAVAIRWAHAVAQESVRRGLHEGLRWKLSCRSDEVKRESLVPLVEAGLTHVYLGVESGDDRSLKHLNKRLTGDVHFRAREILDELGVSFDFGFMLLEPWSTTATVRGNIRFLRAFVGDGSAPATFCRMLPYVGTAAETKLREERRLFENNLQADYDFLDPRLDAYYDWLLDTFGERNFAPGGTLDLLRRLTFEVRLNLPGLPPPSPVTRAAMEAANAVNNQVAFDLLEQGLDHVESSPHPRRDDPALRRLTEHYLVQDARTRQDIRAILPSLAERVEQDLACV
jgi:anaerobic magnesium-protoporphyrin IX monomethyl ester cyclase